MSTDIFECQTSKIFLAFLDLVKSKMLSFLDETMVESMHVLRD